MLNQAVLEVFHANTKNQCSLINATQITLYKHEQNTMGKNVAILYNSVRLL